MSRSAPATLKALCQRFPCNFDLLKGDPPLIPLKKADKFHSRAMASFDETGFLHFEITCNFLPGRSLDKACGGAWAKPREETDGQSGVFVWYSLTGSIQSDHLGNNLIKGNRDSSIQNCKRWRWQNGALACRIKRGVIGWFELFAWCYLFSAIWLDCFRWNDLVKTSWGGWKFQTDGKWWPARLRVMTHPTGGRGLDPRDYLEQREDQNQ